MIRGKFVDRHLVPKDEPIIASRAWRWGPINSWHDDGIALRSTHFRNHMWGVSKSVDLSTMKYPRTPSGGGINAHKHYQRTVAYLSKLYPDNQSFVRGKVALTGAVYEYEDGYRAQHCRILELVAPNTKVADELRKRFPKIPVRVARS